MESLRACNRLDLAAVCNSRLEYPYSNLVEVDGLAKEGERYR
jgi:hypothetical protein